jgi:hypothetical protein
VCEAREVRRARGAVEQLFGVAITVTQDHLGQRMRREDDFARVAAFVRDRRERVVDPARDEFEESRCVVPGADLDELDVAPQCLAVDSDDE